MTPDELRALLATLERTEMTPDTLTARRLAMGMTQRQFAQALGVSEAAVSLWESGKRAIRSTTQSALVMVERAFAERDT
jgi:transcriptional regulator with XRE-family HTH domain